MANRFERAILNDFKGAAYYLRQADMNIQKAIKLNGSPVHLRMASSDTQKAIKIMDEAWERENKIVRREDKKA